MGCLSFLWEMVGLIGDILSNEPKRRRAAWWGVAVVAVVPLAWLGVMMALGWWLNRN